MNWRKIPTLLYFALHGVVGVLFISKYREDIEKAEEFEQPCRDNETLWQTTGIWIPGCILTADAEARMERSPPGGLGFTAREALTQAAVYRIHAEKALRDGWAWTAALMAAAWVMGWLGTVALRPEMITSIDSWERRVAALEEKVGIED